MYHSISAHASRRFKQFTVEPGAFAEHMSALAESGYQPIALSTLAEATQTADRLDFLESAVVLTFDDAFRDFHQDAMPILARFEFPATLYVPSSYVGRTSLWLAREGEHDRPMMSWSELREATQTHIEIGSHSRTHAPLDMLPSTQVRAEVVDSKHELEDALQQCVDTFAYPFGYSTRAVRSAVEAAGYRSACAVRDLVGQSTDPFAIDRLTVPHGMDARDLVSAVSARSTRLAAFAADATAVASLVLRRSGVKHRGHYAREHAARTT
jgi:peptidoglycan/xylan/chitin deacetylase (PgdA/CDA1 family)